MRLLPSLFLALPLMASSIGELVKLYKEKNYYEVCHRGFKMFNTIKSDEDLLSMYAFACLYVDKIDRLSIPILLLGKSERGRHNRAYFSLIIAQKNILVSSVFDGKEYKNLSVPNTDYILSRVFNLYFQKKFTQTDNAYIMQDKYGKYKMFTKYDGDKRWLYIEETRPDGKKYLHKYR
ncbi:MAG: hypothetical protein GXO16_05425 [Epsilonproteobacteria bacterium]|nr:hypothetical protein [Campylobacterota bacterium]